MILSKLSLTRSRQQYSPSCGQILIVFIASFLIGFLFLSWLNYTVSPDYWPIGVDVYPRWVGTRAFWNGQSPYSASVDLETQDLIYGRQAFPGEDSLGFYYPAYASVILAPLALLPVDFAAIIWSSFMFAILVSLVVSSTLSATNLLSPLPWAVLILSCFLYRPALLSVLNGQYGLFVLGCWSFSWWLFQRDRYLISGCLIAFSMIKPSLALIPVSFVVLWSLLSGRTKIALGFFYTFIIMIVISFIRIGWWIPEFLSELGEYSRDLGTWTSKDIFTVPGLFWLLLSGVLIALGYGELKAKLVFPYRLFFGGLFLNLLITPHTLEYDLTVLLLPLIFLLRTLGKSVLGYCYVLFTICVPWVSWLIFTLVGIPIETWWKSIWLFYPLLISGTLIVVEMYKRQLNC